MGNVMAFAKGAQLRTLTTNDYCSFKIQPFIQEILDRFVASDDLKTSIVQAAEHYQAIAETFFDIDLNCVVDSFTLKEEFLFPEQNSVAVLTFSNTRLALFLKASGAEIIREPTILPEIHQLLHRCGQTQSSYEQLRQQLSDPMGDLLDQLIKTCVIYEQPQPSQSVPQFIFPESPGVMRLQHASLLYRTETTGILVDPQLHSNYGLASIQQDITRAMLEGYVDGILISHSHYDHWHYPTLMMFAPETPIIVPKVPRGSITCEDMQAQLHSLGFQQVIAVDWYAPPIVIGDIEVHVLPFYGEQPLVPEYNQPKHPDLRNWGNTYLLRTSYYSSWLLADAGSDPMGSMLDVATTIRQRFGPIDQVLSNFQAMSYNSIGTNLSSWGVDIIGNLLSNPRIFSVTNKAEGFHLATLGPKGVAELCAIVEAKACLPYAHSWAEPGNHAPRDEALINAVMAEIEALRCHTKVIPWRIGESYLASSVTHS